MGQGILCFDNLAPDSFTTITSLTANPASAGFLRLANTDTIDFRTFLNDGNQAFGLEAGTLNRFNFSNAILSRLDQNSVTRSVFTNGNAGAGAYVQISLSTNADDFNISAGSVANGAQCIIQSGAALTGGIVIQSIGVNPLSIQTNSVERIAIAGSGLVTFKQNIAFSPTTAGIKGTTTNDAAAAGVVGELQETTQVLVNFGGTTGAWTLGAQVNLTAGDWDVSGLLEVTANGATVPQIGIGIGTTSGATGVDGDTTTYQIGPTVTYNSSCCVTPKRFSLAAPTSIYLNVHLDFSIGTPKFACRISARRVR